MTKTTFQTSACQEIPVTIHSKWGLRNITLRPISRPYSEIRISVPKMVSTSYALQFLEQKRKWVEKYYASLPQKTHISDGSAIHFLDRDIVIKHDPTGRAGVYMKQENPESPLYMVVCGSVDMIERRVRDEIKKQFLDAVKLEISKAPAKYRPKKVAVRDTSSCWGSCSSTGTMSFCWRLAFAPYDIMRYVVMHELAHKKHMDHSPAFWATVSELYGDGVERAKLWLAKNSGALQTYF